MAEASKEYQEHMKKYETAQAKVDASEKALATAKELARKYKEMQKDLLEPPEERKRGNFQEGYQFLSMGAKAESGETQKEMSEEAVRIRKEKLLEGARKDAKAEFEATRKEMLDRVPEDYKKMFSQAGFAKWGKVMLPALIVSPYDVPMGEGSPREQWIGMLNNVSALSLVRNHSAQSSRPSSGRNSV
jgi:hypothetical protein